MISLRRNKELRSVRKVWIVGWFTAGVSAIDCAFCFICTVCIDSAAWLYGKKRLLVLILGFGLILVESSMLVTLSGCSSSRARSKSVTGELELPTAVDDTALRRRARVRLQLAASYFESGKNAVALDEVKRVMQIDPSFPDAFNLAGLIYQALDQTDLALAHFRRAIALDKRDGSSLHNFAWLLCQQGRYGEAQSNFSSALAVPGYTDRAKTLMAQGICYVRAGNSIMAMDAFRRSYGYDNRNPVTVYNLALLLHQQRRDQQAQTYIRQLNSSNLANAQSLWLGIKVERALDNQSAMRQLGLMLLQNFGDSNEAALYEKGAFND
jgi:type IV pilus assembly protein PilF